MSSYENLINAAHCYAANKGIDVAMAYFILMHRIQGNLYRKYKAMEKN